MTVHLQTLTAYLAAVILMIWGTIGLFSTTKEALTQLSIGFLVLGVGVMGLLKTAIEMFENHRLDKKIS